MASACGCSYLGVPVSRELLRQTDFSFVLVDNSLATPHLQRVVTPIGISIAKNGVFLQVCVCILYVKADKAFRYSRMSPKDTAK